MDNRNVAFQRLRNHSWIAKISVMPTYMTKVQADGFRIPVIWDSAEAQASADWMHEQIMALAPEAVAR